MKKLLLWLIMGLLCVANVTAKDIEEKPIHALVMVEGGYSHSFGNWSDSDFMDYFDSYHRQMRNGYTYKAEAFGQLPIGFSLGVVASRKRYDASEDNLINSYKEEQEIGYIGPAIGLAEYFGPGILFAATSCGFTHFSDKYHTTEYRTNESYSDRFSNGAFGYEVELKYMFCFGDYLMVGPSISYFGCEVNINNDFWSSEYLSLNGFTVTASIGLHF